MQSNNSTETQRVTGSERECQNFNKDKMAFDAAFKSLKIGGI